MDEKEILSFWKEKKIYEKSRKKNKKGKKFYMMDGPPYATGHIHMGTALNKILKDIATRSRRLQGENVFDRAGYDCHGLPIEFQVEKEIGSKTKSDIEKFGVKNFVDKCKKYATQFIGVMNSEFVNLGVWMDFDNPYLTLDNSYIETIWDAFKTADEKKLLYLGKYPVHICPRCETAVAYNEIEYSNVEDMSVFVKFPLKNKNKTFLIIWTTTPWTLPGNTGVMANPDFVYQEIELSNKEKWIIAKDIIPRLMAEFELAYNVREEFKGKEMEGWEYENPLSKNLNLKLKNAYKIVLSKRYVNLEEGTGLVHSAPGHGKEDYEVGREYGLDMPSPVDISGLLTKEAGKYSGKKARIVDREIIEDLEKDDYLVFKKKYKHDYPFCWRCKSPLLMVSMDQWFLKISDIHEKLLKENEKNNWIPGWMKLRMNAWLEGISDWPVSRKRYWGTPLPIWICDCNEKIVVGSIDELEKLSGKKVKEVHKPEIDNIKIKCGKCGKEMKRVPDVLDVWFDSGVSSWAALEYMNDKTEFKKFWAADLNIEGKDQIRGWWNSQLILSVIKFDKKPFDSISVHGMVLDLGKKKMSKSLGNIISPREIIEKYGRDYLRYYFSKISRGEDFAFDENEFKEIEKVFRVLVNVNNFISQLDRGKAKEKIEDKWILSRLNNTIEEAVKNYNNFRFFDCVSAIERFLIFDLSRTYIQMIRDRSDECYDVLNECRLAILKLFAPIIPFVTEQIWQELKEKKIVKEESIHLAEFPSTDKKKINEETEKNFVKVLNIIEKGMAERDKAGIGLKWPLGKAVISSDVNLNDDLREIIARQLNVKKIELKKAEELSVELDTRMTEKLEAEGYARELARKIQSERKKAGLVKKDRINIFVVVDKGLEKMLKGQEKFVKERVNANKIKISTKENKRFKNTAEFTIKEKRLVVTFEQV